MLEAEYEKNSKPDKAARLDIVKRVALGEKEVQVRGIPSEESVHEWFRLRTTSVLHALHDP